MHLCRARGRVWDPGQIISSCTLASNLILALEIYLRSELNSANRNTGIIIVIVVVVCYNIVFCFVFFAYYYSCHNSACTPSEEEKNQAEKAW